MAPVAVQHLNREATRLCSVPSYSRSVKWAPSGLLLGLLMVSTPSSGQGAPPAIVGESTGTATIRYDPPGAGAWNNGIPGPVVGNLFNSQYGDPLSPGTIYWAAANIQYFPYYGGALWVAGPLQGTTAPYLARIQLTRSSGIFAVGSFSPMDVPGSFLVGFRANIGQGVFVASGTTQGQGIHGRYWQGGYNGLPAAQIGTLPGQYGGSGVNVRIRVRGNVAVVAVELMEFDVQ